MRRVEVITPKGEVLWIGPEDAAAKGLGMLSLGLTIRAVLEPIEFEAMPMRTMVSNLGGTFVEESTISAHALEPFIDRKVRVRVEVVE